MGKEDDNNSVCGIHGTGSVRRNEDVRDTEVHVSNEAICYGKNDDSSASATYSELQSGSMLTKDYMELVKSRPVLEKTISKLNLDMEPEDLVDMIKTDTPTDTRIMSISVESEDPKEAKQIADALRKAVSVQIKDIMNADSVNTVEEGNLPTKASSPSVKKNMAIGAFWDSLFRWDLLFLYMF